MTTARAWSSHRCSARPTTPARWFSSRSRLGIQKSLTSQILTEQIHVMWLLLDKECRAVLLEGSLERHGVQARVHGLGQDGEMVPGSVQETGRMLTITDTDPGVQFVRRDVWPLVPGVPVEQSLPGPFQCPEHRGVGHHEHVHRGWDRRSGG